ncbi:MAG: zinc-dependent peptidase [Boseongicola sp.]|nr:zinc-dependent peptidase [Boseongicola sp.]MDD9976156.1 zinc-dependent peptidase [Boseongicola sp.]
MILVVFLGLSVLAYVGYRFWSTHQRRLELLDTPLTDEERAMVVAEVPLLRRLPPELHRSLEGKINLFLDQIDFIGCNGLEVTKAMRLSIAAQACLLIVNTDTWYKTLRTILIYPGAFKSHQTQYSGYVVTEHETVRAGESWSRGPVVLSWADTALGAANHRNGKNVVIHEFAHQIDDLSGHTDGAPILREGQSFAEWARVFTTAYETHVADVERGRQTVIDAYGATNHEEFFAVSVELFFENPVALRNEEPDVYEQLAELFQLEPITWS